MSESVITEDSGGEVQPMSSCHACPEANESVESVSIPTALESKLIRVLCSLGMTPFSANVAFGFIRNGCSKENGMQRLSRVLGFLLDKLNNTREKQWLSHLERSIAFNPSSSSGGDMRPSSTSVSKSAIPVIDVDDPTLAELLPSDDSFDWQCGCPERIRGLRSLPIWPRRYTEFARILEENYEVIKNEFLEARKQRRSTCPLFQPYRAPQSNNSNSNGDSSSSSSSSSSSGSGIKGSQATSVGSWSVCYLHLHGLDFEDNKEIFSKTAEIIKKLPRPYNHSFISAITPGTHITSHFGPTNKKLRCMLPLVVPALTSQYPRGRCWLRVADKRVHLKEGQCIVFDDSFEHEAKYECEEDTCVRVVLVVDIWHPDLTDEEVRILSFIANAQMKALKKLSTEAQSDTEIAQQGTEAEADTEVEIEKEDFFSVITSNRKKLFIPDSQIWGFDVRDD